MVGSQVIKKPIVVVEKITKGVLFENNSNRGVWFKNGNETNDNNYEGEIENNKPNGQGTFTVSDGQKFIGGLKDGIRHGQGTFTYGKGKSGGYKLIGEYRNGVSEGQGGIFYPNGKKMIVGEFKKGQPYTVTAYAERDEVLGEVVKGVTQ